MMKKGADKKGLLILLIFLVGSAAATTMVYRMVAGSSSKRSKAQMSQFGDYLKDKKLQDALDDDETPDEIRRAQMAAGSGQFSDANYGQGSLGFVKGSKPGTGEGQGADGAGGEGGASGGGSGKDGKGGSANAKGAVKGKLGEMAKSKFGSSGASGYNFGNASGGASAGSKSGTSSGASSGSSGSKTGKSATSAKTGTISARSSSSKSRRGAIGDLAKRSNIAYGSGASGASYAAAGLDQAMAGKGSGVDVSGANMADSGLYESELASQEETSSADTPTNAVDAESSSGASCPGQFCWSAQATEDEPAEEDVETWDSMYQQSSTIGDINEGFQIGSTIVAGTAAAALVVMLVIIAATAATIPVAGWIVAAVALVVAAVVALITANHRYFFSKIVIDEKEEYTISMPWNADAWTFDSIDKVAILDTESVAAIPWSDGSYILYYQFKVGEDKKNLELDGDKGCSVLFDYNGYVAGKGKAEVLLPIPKGDQMYRCVVKVKEGIEECKAELSNTEDQAFVDAIAAAETTNQGCIDYKNLYDVEECKFD